MKKPNPIISTCLALLLAAPTLAATLEGLRFEDRTQLAGTELKLNGLGLRSVFFIKGYVIGMYLNGKASNLQEAGATAGPKRLHIRLLRDVSAEDFKKSMVAGIQKNVSEDQMLALRDRIRMLEHAIDSIGTAKVGDTLMLDYVPERGTTLSQNDVARGSAIQGVDFYNAILAIYLGENPVDRNVKKGLLSQ
ncbi:MAG: chalcone isomerase family protein [Burkholderiaceae bacterium]